MQQLDEGILRAVGSRSVEYVRRRAVTDRFSVGLADERPSSRREVRGRAGPSFRDGDTGARDPLVPPDFEDPRGATLAEELFGR